MQPQVVFVLGRPGAGKGTQCKNIEKEFGYVHLSAGELLREEKKKPNSQYAETINEHFRKHIMVPVAITLNLLETAMKKCNSNKFLIDGFPRDQENLDGWKANMADKVKLRAVLFLDCPEEISTRRCLDRGAQGGDRDDDNLESLKKRFDIYGNDTVPVIKYYDTLNLVRRVDATKSTQLVFQDIHDIFQEFQ